MGRSTKIKLPIDLRDLLVKCHLKVKDIPDSAKKLKNGYKVRKACFLSFVITYLPLCIFKVAMNGRNDGKKKMEIETPEIHTCAECKKSADQHLMIDCDTCQFFYHIACLDPPLTHVPVKAQQWGWECSKCAESDSEEESDTTLDLDTPRQLRTFRKPVQRLSISSPDHRRKMHPHVRMKSPLHTNGLRSPSIVSCQKDETEPNFLNLITFVGSIAVKSFSSQPTPSTSQFASPGKSISRK